MKGLWSDGSEFHSISVLIFPLTGRLTARSKPEHSIIRPSLIPSHQK